MVASQSGHQLMIDLPGGDSSRRHVRQKIQHAADSSATVAILKSTMFWPHNSQMGRATK
jgi:hypothetical protein